MSTRRRYHERSDDEEETSPKRRRPETEKEDIESGLKSLIYKLGDRKQSKASIESNLESLANVLVNDIPHHKAILLKIISQCVISLPEKLTLYTTLVGLLNAKNHHFGADFVDTMVRNLKETLKTYEFDRAKLIIRFLTDLVNCRVISSSSLLKLFDSFVEVTIEEANIPQVRSDWYVFSVVSALPWVGKEMSEKHTEKFDKLLRGIGDYIKGRRQKVYHLALRVWSTDDPHPQEEYLDCLWAQIKRLEADKWILSRILRPYFAFESQLSGSLQHTLPQIIPPSHRDDAEYPLPRVVFRLFDYTDVPEEFVLPGAHAIERFLIEEQIEYILDQYYIERKDCTAQLLQFPHNFFERNEKIPVHYMIVEAMLGQLFRLPTPPHIEIAYSAIFFELSKTEPESIPQILAQATELIYDRLDTMNLVCMERFCLWFSHHLSNYQYTWSWDEWPTALEGDQDTPKQKFVREVLNRCLRFGYHGRLFEILPETFHVLVPPKPEHVFDFDNESSTEFELAKKLTKKMQERDSDANDMMVSLRELPNFDPNDTKAILEVFIQVLLHLGAKSYSHSFAALNKYHVVIKQLVPSEEMQTYMLSCIYKVWKNSPQTMCVLVDKLVRAQIVEAPSVANWIFSSEMSPEFTKFFLWEILNSTIKKVNDNVNKQQRDYEDMRDRLDAARRSMDFDQKPDEVLTEDMVEKKEELVEEAQSLQKNLFLIIFQRFNMTLTDHLIRCEGSGVDYNTFWYKWSIERLQQIFLTYQIQVHKYMSTLETLIFTTDTDPHILEVFQRFCALRA